MFRSAIRVLLIFAVGGWLSLGCATSSRSRVVVCVTIPYPQDALNPLVAALEAEGIVHSPVTVVDTGSGGCDFCVRGKNAEHAKHIRQVIEKAISEHALTVRVSKDVDHPIVYEVYESGRKIREESYER